MSYVNQTLPLPEMNVLLDFEKKMKDNNYTQDTTIEEVLQGYTGADCWAIKVKYTCHEKPIVEYNEYYKQDNNNEYYKQDNISRVKGNQFRDYVYDHTTEFLKTIDWVNVYMFGSYDHMLKLTRYDNTFKIEFFE